jgi:dipeptidyl aminopeptidase/acylaminoacyl peptidase
MNNKCVCALALLLAATATVRGVDYLPVEDFSHEEAYTGLTLSPDGQAIVYDESIKGDQRLFLRDLGTGQKIGIELEGSNVAWSHYTEFFWVNNRRVVFRAHGRYAAIDRDGTHAIYSLPGAEVMHLFRDEKDGMMLVSGYDIKVGSGLRMVTAYQPLRPFIRMINPRTGNSSYVEENPGNIRAWGIDAQGKVKVAVEIKGTQYRALYREDEKASWETLPGMDWSDPQVRPVGFSADGKILYVTRVTPEGTWGIYPYELAQRRFGEVLIAHAKYDIIPGYNPAGAAGVLHQSPIYSPKERELLGYRYLTEFPCTFWISPEMAQVQKVIDEALPQKINTITSMSDDRQRMIVYSWTANDPGKYYLYDGSTGQMEKIMARRPWISPDNMSEMQPIRFKSRDGLTLNGYLVLPRDREQTDLPLVVVVNRSLFTRQTWEFDATAQFLANRGYAVLFVNTRGVTGYGQEFFERGHRKLGDEIPFDLADGARWAIAKGIADPNRVAILGVGDLAGAVALTSLGVEPDLYRCGLASAPFTDWIKVINKGDLEPDAYVFLTQWVGDPATEAERLRATSPLNLAGKIKASVLLMHDKKDLDWYYNQTKAMHAALKKAGRTAELINVFDEEKYGYQRHAKWLSGIEDFLSRNMAPKR